MLNEVWVPSALAPPPRPRVAVVPTASAAAPARAVKRLDSFGLNMVSSFHVDVLDVGLGMILSIGPLHLNVALPLLGLPRVQQRRVARGSHHSWRAREPHAMSPRQRRRQLRRASPSQ